MKVFKLKITVPILLFLSILATSQMVFGVTASSIISNSTGSANSTNNTNFVEAITVDEPQLIFKDDQFAVRQWAQNAVMQ